MTVPHLTWYLKTATQLTSSYSRLRSQTSTPSLCAFGSNQWSDSWFSCLTRQNPSQTLSWCFYPHLGYSDSWCWIGKRKWGCILITDPYRVVKWLRRKKNSTLESPPVLPLHQERIKGYPFIPSCLHPTRRCGFKNPSGIAPGVIKTLHLSDYRKLVVPLRRWNNF